MTDARPNPDALLQKITAEDSKAARGKLKIFFGSNAGVGKTYAMLEEARKRAAEGMEVLIGYAEAHIRPDTELLLLGMEILPYKLVEYQNATLKEFDLDGALARKPALLCVDELAHTNAPGLRHAKRWQDVEELLNAGINVYTTLNVQHLESVNDIVERITGVTVRETLPDAILEKADEVELIDISPDELIERLREGKIYKPQQAETALKHFFNRGNLMALRELALRRTAERVDAQMQDFRTANAISKPWAAQERILVSVGPSPFAAQLIRSTKRLANAFRSPWFAVHVETPGGMSAEAKDRLAQNLKLAQQLGGEVVTLAGDNFLEELLAFARQRNITKIVIGKPARPRWKDWLRGTVVDELLRQTSQIDVYVIRQEKDPGAAPRPVRTTPHSPWPAYMQAAAISIAATLVGMFVFHVLGGGKTLSNTNALMIDLLAVLFIATRFGRGPALMASLLAVLGFDFTVVPPFYSFSVSDSQYLFTFLVMLATALVISTLADRIRRQSVSARQRERRTAALLALSKELAATREKRTLLQIAARHIAEVFDSPALLMLPNAKGELCLATASSEIPPLDDKESGVAQWVFSKNQAAGHGTSTLPSATGLYLPLSVSTGPVGVLGLASPSRVVDTDQMQQLEAFANQTALAVERASLAEESQRAWERVEAEFLRNTLLSGVSHDLRTPLAAITGAASTLAQANAALSEESRKQLAESIVQDSNRMERLITNLLDITRIESGGMQLKLEWHPVLEIIGSALHQSRQRLAHHSVTTHVPSDLPLLRCDALAMEQVLTNLLDNAAAYTREGTPIDIAADFSGGTFTLAVADSGPGIPPDHPEKIFQKFFRGTGKQDNGQRKGIGLGLAICKGIVELHQGSITAQNRPDGGALFRVSLPQPPAPRMPAE